MPFITTAFSNEYKIVNKENVKKFRAYETYCEASLRRREFVQMIVIENEHGCEKLSPAEWFDWKLELIEKGYRILHA